MADYFNLLDEPWVPCARAPGSPPELFSIRSVLAEAAALWRIVEPRPTCAVAIHRLLLAVLHRALDGPRTRDAWRTVWNQRAWDRVDLDVYLTKWHQRFDLFDPTHPFYQTPGLAAERAYAVNTLAHERASNVNSPMLFDHVPDGASCSTAEAARLLIGHQQFTTAGLISDDQTSAGKVSASASPLMGALVCLAQGHTLFETLMLNWVQYDPDHERPFPVEGDDQPVWERDAPAIPVQRKPSGYVDLLTWPSRRILLIPEHDATGQTVVSRAVLMDGARFTPKFAQHEAETMVAFACTAQKENEKEDAHQPWRTVRPEQERGVWRESYALFAGFNTMHHPPKTLQWLATVLPDELTAYRVIPIDVMGVIPHQKNVVDWLQETLPLPRHMLASAVMVDELRQALEFAEALGELLISKDIALPSSKKMRFTPMKTLCCEYLIGVSGRKPLADDATKIAKHLHARQEYWARLEVPFHRFLKNLPSDIIVDEYDEEIARGEARQAWARAAKDACRDTFAGAIDALGELPRALRAGGKAQIAFAVCLRALLEHYRIELAQGVAV